MITSDLKAFYQKIYDAGKGTLFLSDTSRLFVWTVNNHFAMAVYKERGDTYNNNFFISNLLARRYQNIQEYCNTKIGADKAGRIYAFCHIPKQLFTFDYMSSYLAKLLRLVG